MGTYGELTGGQTGGIVAEGGADTLPDTAMAATAPITLVGVMLVLVGGLVLRRRIARGEGWQSRSSLRASPVSGGG